MDRIDRIERVERSQLAETVRRWFTGLSLPLGWRVSAIEAEQGIAIGFQGPRGRLLVELDIRDEERDCYARTERLNVYYSRVDRLRRDLDDAEHAVMRAVVQRARAYEHELPPPAEAVVDPQRVHVRELTVDHALVREGPGSYYVNPYVGCLLACPYCYAMHRADASRLLSGDPVVPWGKWVDVKVDLPDVLAREVLAYEPGVVRMSPIVTDPYQPIERRYRVTRRCLDVLAGTDFVPMILTRSSVVLDDLDRLAAFPRSLVGMSIPTDDDTMRAAFEPRTPSIEERLAALRALSAAGLCTFVVIQPMLPMDPLRLVEAVAPYVQAVRIAPMFEKPRALPLYRAVGREDAAGDAWEIATFETLRAAFEARGLPVTTGENLAALLPRRNSGAPRSSVDAAVGRQLAFCVSRASRCAPLPWSLLFAIAAIAGAWPSREARAGETHVIPPGREPIVLRMLCEEAGAPLPSDCRCDGVRIEPTFIRANYACRGRGEVVFELRHPSDAAGAHASTSRFAVVARGGPPSDLLPGLLTKIRAAEGEWSWTAPTGTGGKATTAGGAGGTYPLTVALVAVVALSLSWWAASSRPREAGERSA